MADDDKVCGQCGTPAVSETTEQAAPEASADTAETPAFDNASKPVKGGVDAKKMIFIGIAAAVAIALIVLIIIFVPKLIGGGSPKGVIDKFFTAVKNEDPEKMVTYLSGLDTNSEDYDEDDAIELMESTIDMFLDIMEEKVDGENVKSVSVEIGDKDIKELSDRKFKNCIEDLEESDEYDEDYLGSIKSIAKVKVKLNIKGDEGETGKYTVDAMYLVKEKGGWKILLNESLVRGYFK